MKRFRVAAVQCRWDLEIRYNVETTLLHIAEAAADGVDVVLFPEANVTGYDYDYAVDIPPDQIDAALREIRAACREARVNAIVGTLQRRGEDPRFLNIAHVIDRSGAVHYEYAKVQLAGSAEVKLCRPGGKVALFDLEGTRCTIAICRDGRHPELSTVPAMAGAQVYFQPTNNCDTLEKSWWKMEAGRSTQPIGPRSSIHHVVANAVGQNRAGTLVSYGQSCIRDATGLPLIEAGLYEETMIAATLDMDRATGRYPRDSMASPLILADEWKRMIKIVMDHKDDEVA